MLGVGALPVQGDSARADFPRAAVDGVEGVPRADGVHHCPVFPVVGVHRQDLQTADGGTLTGVLLPRAAHFETAEVSIMALNEKKWHAGIRRRNISEKAIVIIIRTFPLLLQRSVSHRLSPPR